MIPTMINNNVGWNWFNLVSIKFLLDLFYSIFEIENNLSAVVNWNWESKLLFLVRGARAGPGSQGWAHKDGMGSIKLAQLMAKVVILDKGHE